MENMVTMVNSFKGETKKKKSTDLGISFTNIWSISITKITNLGIHLYEIFQPINKANF